MVIDIRELKRMVGRLPRHLSIVSVIQVEDDTIAEEEYLIKVRVWLRLLVAENS